MLSPGRGDLRGWVGFLRAPKMDFTAMKRRDLQALCKRHGLNAGGSNAGLVARLAAALSGSGGAEEDALGVVVGKGCLKRSAAGASGGDSDAAKKVTFVLEKEEEEPEVGGRRLRSQVSLSQVVTKTRGRPRAAQGSQVGGDSADQSDAGEAGADAVTRWSRRNSVNFGAGDVVERLAGAVGRKTSAKAEQQEVDAGEAVGRKHRLKRKSRENDADNVDISVQVGVSRRSTRSSALQSEPAAALSPVVDNKRVRKKARDLKEQNCVKEQPTEIQHVGRTLRSGLVLATPPLSTVSENKRSRSKVPERETALEKVAELEISGRTTRSSSVATAATSPIVVAKKRRKTENVHLDEGPHTVPNEINDAPVTRVLRNRAVQAIDSTAEELSIEQVAAPCKGLPQRRSRRNPYEADMLLNNNTTSQSSNDLKVAHLIMRNAAKDGVEDGVAKRDGHVGFKTSKMSKGRATVATNGGAIPLSDSSDKASAMDMEVELPWPARRSMRKSVAPSYLEHETKGMHGDVGMKETVKKPVGRSTRRSVAPVIIERDCKGFSKEMIPEAHVKRPRQKSVVPTMIRKGRKIIVTDMIPEAHVNNENGDHTKMISAKGGQLEKQLVVKEPCRRSTRKSVAPHVIEKETKGFQEESKSEVPVRTSLRKLSGPNAVDKESKDHTEIITREESSVRTRSAQTRVQYPVQNDVSLRQTRHRSSKLAISPVQSKPTASKGRLAKRSRIASLEEVMPAEEHKEDQIAYGGHTSDMIDVASANGLESGGLFFPAEKSDLRDSQPNYQLEGTVVESSISHGKDVSNILEFELESTVVGTTEKPPSDLAFLDCKHAGASSEDALDSIENDAGRCSRDLEQPPTGLQFLFSQGDIKGSDTDNTSSSFKNGIEESVVHKVECQVETVYSLKLDSHEGSDDYSIRVEESGGLLFTSQQNDEQEGFPVDCVASVQLDSSEVVHHTVRDVSRQDMTCNEEEKTDFIPSDISAPQKNPHANEPAEHVSGVSGALFCISQSTTIIDEVNLYSSQLSVGDLDNHISSSNTEGLQHDDIEECNVHNERITEGIHAGVMSEAAQIAVPESVKMLQPDEQLKHKPEGNELKGQSFSRSEDESPKESTSCEDQIVLGPGICQTVAQRYTYVVSVTDHNDECNQHSEDQLTSGTEPALVEETTPFPDEQFTTKLEGNTEQSLILHEDSGNVSITKLLGNNYLSSLKDPTMDPCHDQELPNGMPAPKSPRESAVFLDDKVLALVQSLTCDKDGSNVSDTGSFGNKNLSSLKDPSLDLCHDQDHPSDMAAPKSPEESAVCMDNRVSASAVFTSGICRTSGSIVKGNYISMHPLRTVKQVDNLSQSAAALLRNRENTPCKPDTLGPRCDHLFVIDSLEPLLTEAGLAVGSPDEKLPMEQVQQDDLQVQEGTVERGSLSVEQSPFSVPTLFSQESLEEPSEEVAHSSARVLAENRVCESKIVSDHDISVDFSAVSESGDCLDTSQQDNENEGLMEASHEQEQVAANCMEDADSEEVAYDEETKKPGSEEGCDKGGSNYLETESVVNSIRRNILSTSSLPKDCSTDDYQQMELFEGFSEKKSPEEASMCLEASDPRAVSATIENHSLDLAIRDFKHEGALSEDAVSSMKNTESCSRDHRQLSIGLHHLFPQESLKGSDVYDDIVLASTKNEDDSNTPHVEKMASSEPDSHQCSLEDLSIVEEIRGLFSSQLDNEHEGFLSSSQKTECVASAQLHSSEDRNLMEREIITEVICTEEEKQGIVPSRDTDTRHETSHTDEPDEQRIALLQAAETSASPDKQLSSDLEQGKFEEHNFSSEETSGILGVGSVKSNVFHLHEDSHCDPIQGKELPIDLYAPKSPEQSAIGQDESVLGSGISQTVVQKRTEEINTKLQHERQEECSKYIDQATLLSECALFGGSVSGMTLLPAAETSSLPDEQIDPELECDEFEEPDHSHEKDVSYLLGSGSVKNNLPHLGHNEECYEHIDDPAILSSGMRKPSPSLIRGSESGIALQSAEETSALTNEHVNFKMDEQGLYFDIDISDMSDTGLMENNNLSSLPKDNTYMETWNENEVLVGTPAAKSSGESAVCPDDRVPGSVGICQTSGRRRIDEISTKLLSFKISSAVKGSYIAMDSADPKQGAT